MSNNEKPVKMDALLTSWGLSDLISDFQENKIDVDVLPDLSEELIKEVIKPVGWRLKFIQVWEGHFQKSMPKQVNDRQDLRSPNNPVDPNRSIISPNDDDDDSDAENNPNNSKQYDNYIGGGMLKQLQQLPKVEQILKESPEGRQVLNSYRKRKCLGRLGRRSVVEVLTSFLLNHVEGKANHKDFHYFSEEIINLFPNEDASYYYIPPVSKQKSTTGKSISVRGRLALKYWTRLKKFRQLDTNEDTESNSQLNTDIEESVQQSIDWLRNNRSPWDLILRHWEVTSNIREQEFFNEKNKNLVEIFKNWPILNHPEAYTLILEDFKNFKFTDDEIDYNAAEKWSDFFEKVKTACPLDSKKKKDPRIVHLFNLMDAAETEDGKSIIQLRLLSFLVAPKGRLRGPKRSDWKYSMSECEESIVQHATTIDDITRTCENYKDIMNEKKLKVQPHILVVGPELNEIEKIYVIIDDTKYEVQSVIKALDVCFKSFFVFQAQFPPAGQHIWFLIQRGLYNFTTSTDKLITYVLEVVTDIKNMDSM